MTPRKKPNNARKSAARAIQRETGLRYKKALAALDNPAPPASRVITADRFDPSTGSAVLSCVPLGVQIALEALEIPPPRPAWAPDWWQPSRGRLGENWACHNTAAYMVLTAILVELVAWSVAAQHAAAVAQIEGGLITGFGLDSASLRMELPAGSALAKSAPEEQLSEPLAPSERDSPWARFVVERLDELHEQLVPFHGAPVDDLRSVAGHLQRWLTDRDAA